jgi:hypothetical protein
MDADCLDLPYEIHDGIGPGVTSFWKKNPEAHERRTDFPLKTDSERQERTRASILQPIEGRDTIPLHCVNG